MWVLGFWEQCVRVSHAGTLKRRRQQQSNGQQPQQQRNQRQPRENYQLGQMRRWDTGPLFALVLPSAYSGNTSLQRVTCTIHCNHPSAKLTGNRTDFNRQDIQFQDLTLNTTALGASRAVLHTAVSRKYYRKALGNDGKRKWLISFLFFSSLECRGEQQHCGNAAFPLLLFSVFLSSVFPFWSAALLSRKTGLQVTWVFAAMQSQDVRHCSRRD